MLNLDGALSLSSPLASALASLLFLLVTACIYAAFLAIFDRKARPSNKPGSGGIFFAIKTFDKILVNYYSYVTGTRYNNKKIRVFLVFLYFLLLSVASSIIVFPFNFVAILFGVVGIYVVFRHWSVDEDEAVDNLPKSQKQISIEDDLHAEVKIAVAFLFVLAPIAFSSLQEHGYGFRTASEIGPFTFLFFTITEAVKAGSIVDYYDLWADRLGFEHLSGVKDPTDHAKWMIIGYRLALNLLILVAIKRFLDIAKRKSEGFDLRHIEEVLKNKDDKEHDIALEQLKNFALRGRGNARDLLEKIAVPNTSEGYVLGPHQRSAAADVLYDYAIARGVSSALYGAVAGYQHLIATDWKKDREPQLWAMTQNDLGNTLLEIGEQTGDINRLNQAVEALTKALEVRTRDEMPAAWAATQNNLGNTLNLIGQQTGDINRLNQAIEAYTKALEVRTRDEMPADWAATQNNLGFILLAIGQQTGDINRLNQAVEALTKALEVRTRDEMPADWAMTQNNLGGTLNSIGRQTGDVNRLNQAAEAYTKALEVRTRDEMPAAWAATQNNLGNTLDSIGRQTGDINRLNQSVEAYTKALEVRTRYEMPAAWAQTQNNLGFTLLAIGQQTGDINRLNQALEALTKALDVHTRDEMPADWAMTQNNLGSTLSAFGQQTSDVNRLNQAVEAFTKALEVRTRDEMPRKFARTSYRKGLAHLAIGKHSRSVDAYNSAIQCFKDAQSIITRDEDAVGWSVRQNEVAKAHMAIYSITKDQDTLARAKQVIALALEVDAENENFKETAAEIEAAVRLE